MLSFDPDQDILDLAGKTVFITGGTAGLGEQTVLALSKHNPKHIYFTGRNAARASSIISQVRTISKTEVTFLECDQSSLVSVSKAASQFLAKEDYLDILICNAGVMGIPAALTKDGYEIQFGINHISHALFVDMFLPSLEKSFQRSADARVIFVASLGATHTPPGGISFQTLKKKQENLGVTAKWMRYGQSKLANILYAYELAKRYPWLTTVSLEPGTVWTGLLSNLGWVDRMLLWMGTWWKTYALHEGAYNSCWAATAERKEIESGKMYQPVGVRVRSISYMEDSDLAAKLWEWTKEELASQSESNLDL
ncbi:dehydrogenase with different specificitie [Clohesyomyces aquaticus]|uniref:Dehydrogenase with different specificitie n=1 Tax=Clohesyomyces aquaticus TaxID=1231657 RepID=A0A1Y2ACS3_9PLEO|nr:dehydrogenase with different specificitie [Clohesyomyces aquaticus]